MHLISRDNLPPAGSFRRQKFTLMFTISLTTANILISINLFCLIFFVFYLVNDLVVGFFILLCRAMRDKEKEKEENINIFFDKRLQDTTILRKPGFTNIEKINYKK